MDMATALIGLLVIAICTLPFWLVSRSRKKEEATRRNKLMEEAANVNCELGEVDLGMCFAIALSNTKRYVFFYDAKGKTPDKVVTIDLQTIKKFAVSQGRHQATIDQKQLAVTNKVELLGHYKEAKIPPVVMTFYDADRNLQFSNEYLLAEKWEKNLNGILTK